MINLLCRSMINLWCRSIVRIIKMRLLTIKIIIIRQQLLLTIRIRLGMIRQVLMIRLVLMIKTTTNTLKITHKINSRMLTETTQISIKITTSNKTSNKTSMVALTTKQLAPTTTLVRITIIRLRQIVHRYRMLISKNLRLTTQKTHHRIPTITQLKLMLPMLLLNSKIIITISNEEGSL